MSGPLERQADIANAQAETAARQADVAESGQQTDRFTKAVEQLGSASTDVRTGGLFALAALAQDHPARFAATIYDIVVVYIQEHTVKDPEIVKQRQSIREQNRELEKSNAHLKPVDQQRLKPLPQYGKIGTDVAAALQVLSQNRTLFDSHHPELDLSEQTRGAHLVGVDLSDRNLTGASFDEATLTNTHFDEATLTNTHFNDADLTNTHFYLADLTNTHFYLADLTNTSFDRATLTHTHFNDAALTHTSFLGATLTNTHFNDATLTNTHFDGATLTYTSFRTAALTHTSFDEATLTYTSFRTAALTNTHFDRATLTDTSFGRDDLGRRLVSVDAFTLSSLRTKARLMDESTREQLAQLEADDQPADP